MPFDFSKFQNIWTPNDNIREDHAMEPHDSGWRKYFLVLVGMGLLTWGFWWTGESGIAKEILERRSISYTTFGEFLIGLVGLYYGANTIYKGWAGSTNSKTMTELAKAQAPEPKPEEKKPQ